MQFLIRFKGLFYLPLVIRFFDESLRDAGIGTWKLIMTVSPLMIPILTLNLLDGSLMFFSSDFDQESVSKKFSSVFIFSVFSFSLLLIPVGFFLSNNETFSSYWLQIISLAFAMFIFKAGLMLLQCYQKAKKIVLVQFISEYGSSTISVVCVIFTSSFKAMLYPIIGINLLLGIGLLIYVFREIKFRFEVNFSFIKKCVIVALPLIPVHVSEWVLNSIGIFQIEAFHGLELVGKFTYLLSICALVLILKATLPFFWYSTASNLLRNKKEEEFKNIFEFVFQGYLILVVFAFLLINFFGDVLITIMYTKENLELLKNPVVFYGGAYGLLILASLFNGILYALGKTFVILCSYIVSSFILASFGYLLIPKYGLLGASLSAVASNLVLFISMSFFSARYLAINLYSIFFKITFFCALFVVLSLSLKFIFDLSYWQYKIAGCIVVLFYLVLVGIIKKNELLRLINIIKKKL